jgi:hypothetical protein
MTQLRWVFGRTNVVRMAGVAVLGLVLTLFSWLGARGALSSDDATVDVQAWRQSMELGVLVMCFALLFVAVGLLMGLPEGEREPGPPPPAPPPTDHWS